ncbi:hypothetical protein Ocin01_12638 [Orchesella cincta]|uniref:Uncharacterized protein n=1 Tax=Orchesella cincta TaxID=48709 RepID=A0A1D2MLX2_ORCCI|nr:hypothetical protein Ocin01_12638 [Orchesella cincta]
MSFVKPFILLLALATPALCAVSVNKTANVKIWAHLMPWFETRATSDDGSWGIHWTMASKNPDNFVDGTGRRDIAAHYYPADDVYGSGDPAVIERQLNQMKYAGIDGILLDWPGTVPAWDYPKNLRNSEAIIAQLERMGLEFAIVYEDHNIGMAADAGFISDKIGAARNDMTYMQNNYFNRPNYIKMDGRPLLLDFGPQTFKSPGEWDQIFSVLNPRPEFYTLWYQMNEAAGSSVGEYCWIYNDFLTGLNHFYQFHTAPKKIGGAYPGFNTFYNQGGWPGPDWSIPHNGVETFRQTLNMALQYNLPIQLATWNDYGEGTMIEPTREFGNGFLDILQQSLVPQYSTKELDIISDLYKKRVEYANQKGIQSILDQASDALANLEPEKAAEILRTVQ